ncbi:hypothetical protein GMRT_13288 [Giardia muris]|uniref:Uncharacterized protein n=1 Tax=Giardia muris TaxID=5742 RepID=A0A4Z1SKV1_GIAMU|nr:hypothetical protein GMRT_13288 [Giardia muris]|eukprot:TNJ26252.1 hypothetical protein GMRT_13288 [Giardia muris]
MWDITYRKYLGQAPVEQSGKHQRKERQYSIVVGGLHDISIPKAFAQQAGAIVGIRLRFSLFDEAHRYIVGNELLTPVFRKVGDKRGSIDSPLGLLCRIPIGHSIILQLCAVRYGHSHVKTTGNGFIKEPDVVAITDEIVLCWQLIRPWLAKRGHGEGQVHLQTISKEYTFGDVKFDRIYLLKGNPADLFDDAVDVARFVAETEARKVSVSCALLNLPGSSHIPSCTLLDLIKPPPIFVARPNLYFHPKPDVSLTVPGALLNTPMHCPTMRLRIPAVAASIGRFFNYNCPGSEAGALEMATYKGIKRHIREVFLQILLPQLEIQVGRPLSRKDIDVKIASITLKVVPHDGFRAILEETRDIVLGPLLGPDDRRQRPPTPACQELMDDEHATLSKIAFDKLPQEARSNSISGYDFGTLQSALEERLTQLLVVENSALILALCVRVDVEQNQLISSLQMDSRCDFCLGWAPLDITKALFEKGNRVTRTLHLKTTDAFTIGVPGIELPILDCNRDTGVEICPSRSSRRSSAPEGERSVEDDSMSDELTNTSGRFTSLYEYMYPVVSIALELAGEEESRPGVESDEGEDEGEVDLMVQQDISKSPNDEEPSAPSIPQDNGTKRRNQDDFTRPESMQHRTSTTSESVTKNDSVQRQEEDSYSNKSAIDMYRPTRDKDEDLSLQHHPPPQEDSLGDEEEQYHSPIDSSMHQPDRSISASILHSSHVGPSNPLHVSMSEDKGKKGLNYAHLRVTTISLNEQSLRERVIEGTGVNGLGFIRAIYHSSSGEVAIVDGPITDLSNISTASEIPGCQLNMTSTFSSQLIGVVICLCSIPYERYASREGMYRSAVVVASRFISFFRSSTASNARAHYDLYGRFRYDDDFDDYVLHLQGSNSVEVQLMTIFADNLFDLLREPMFTVDVHIRLFTGRRQGQLGANAIPNRWLSNTTCTTSHFITDGVEQALLDTHKRPSSAPKAALLQKWSAGKEDVLLKDLLKTVREYIDEVRVGHAAFYTSDRLARMAVRRTKTVTQSARLYHGAEVTVCMFPNLEDIIPISGRLEITLVSPSRSYLQSSGLELDFRDQHTFFTGPSGTSPYTYVWKEQRNKLFADLTRGGNLQRLLSPYVGVSCTSLDPFQYSAVFQLIFSMDHYLDDRHVETLATSVINVECWPDLPASGMVQICLPYELPSDSPDFTWSVVLGINLCTHEVFVVSPNLYGCYISSTDLQYIIPTSKVRCRLVTTGTKPTTLSTSMKQLYVGYVRGNNRTACLLPEIVTHDHELASSGVLYAVYAMSGETIKKAFSLGNNRLVLELLANGFVFYRVWLTLTLCPLFNLKNHNVKAGNFVKFQYTELTKDVRFCNTSPYNFNTDYILPGPGFYVLGAVSVYASGTIPTDLKAGMCHILRVDEVESINDYFKLELRGPELKKITYPSPDGKAPLLIYEKRSLMQREGKFTKAGADHIQVKLLCGKHVWARPYETFGRIFFCARSGGGMYIIRLHLIIKS